VGDGNGGSKFSSKVNKSLCGEEHLSKGLNDTKKPGMKKWRKAIPMESIAPAKSLRLMQAGRAPGIDRSTLRV
jgi:hypothetical protein